ncbi:unnamed protein product, partial [Hymenolepis diminuta]
CNLGYCGILCSSIARFFLFYLLVISASIREKYVQLKLSSRVRVKQEDVQFSIFSYR